MSNQPDRTDRDADLREHQIEVIQEDIKMHAETDEVSPLEGAIEHIERVQEDKEDAPTTPNTVTKEEPKKVVKPKKKG